MPGIMARLLTVVTLMGHAQSMLLPSARVPRASPSMVAAGTLLDEFPQATITPVQSVELQCLALQQQAYRVFWRFVSPEGKRTYGIKPAAYGIGLRPAPTLAPPAFAELPLYAPLVSSHAFKVVGGLPVSDVSYKCRVRVWPSGGQRECSGDPLPLLPVEYIFALTLQPLRRPACYEDDPLQSGISAGPPFAGCWLVDTVKLDDRWGGDRDGTGADGPTGGGAKRRRRNLVPVPPASKLGISRSLVQWP